MRRVAWRAVTFAAIVVAVLLAGRDMLGFSDLNPVDRKIPPTWWCWHAWGFIRLLMVFVAATVARFGASNPNARTLAAALIGISFNNNWWFFSIDDPLLWPSVALNYLLLPVGLTFFLIFAANSGRGDWLRVRAISSRVAPYLGIAMAACGTLWWVSALGIASAACGTLWWVSELGIAVAPCGTLSWVSALPVLPKMPLLDQLFWVGWNCINLAAIVTSVIAIRFATGNDRKATIWIAASFAVAAAGTLTHGIDRMFRGETDWANIVDTLSQLALPLGLGYAILRHRALEIEFLANRATVFGGLVTCLGFGFKLAEVLTDQQVQHRKIVPETLRLPAARVEFAASLIVVLSFKWLEDRVEHLLDRWREPKDGVADAETEIAHLQAPIREPKDGAADAESKIAHLRARIRALEAAGRKTSNRRRRRKHR